MEIQYTFKLSCGKCGWYNISSRKGTCFHSNRVWECRYIYVYAYTTLNSNTTFTKKRIHIFCIYVGFTYIVYVHLYLCLVRYILAYSVWHPQSPETEQYVFFIINISICMCSLCLVFFFLLVLHAQYIFEKIKTKLIMGIFEYLFISNLTVTCHNIFAEMSNIREVYIWIWYFLFLGSICVECIIFICRTGKNVQWKVDYLSGFGNDSKGLDP